LAVFIAVVFLGCDHSGASVSGGEGTITLTVGEGEKYYYSLTTGEEVTGNDIKTNKWDIGFQRDRTILTNSGVTASELGSGGKGSVWYTEKTDFDAVTPDDAVKDGSLTKYFADIKGWFYSMSSNKETTFNVINYCGYESGDGTSSDPFKTAKYDQKQFYKRESSSNYPVTNVVYIIQHGDGKSYSKIQVSQYEYASSDATDTYVLKYEKF
jgi:hypothetical protein